MHQHQRDGRGIERQRQRAQVPLVADAHLVGFTYAGEDGSRTREGHRGELHTLKKAGARAWAASQVSASTPAASAGATR